MKSNLCSFICLQSRLYLRASQRHPHRHHHHRLYCLVLCCCITNCLDWYQLLYYIDYNMYTLYCISRYIAVVSVVVFIRFVCYTVIMYQLLLKSHSTGNCHWDGETLERTMELTNDPGGNDEVTEKIYSFQLQLLLPLLNWNETE